MREKTNDALNAIKAHVAHLWDALRSKVPSACCAELLGEIGQFGSQGIYLLDQQGELKDCAVPDGLDAAGRKEKTPALFDRPYFRIAKSFREPYISDSFKSVFNGNSTIALCVPIMDGIDFRDLVFAATHVGTWDWLIARVKMQWNNGRSVVLIDSNGIALFPPNHEISLRTPTKKDLLVQSEKANANIGHGFEDLFALSRRDALIKHLVENIVPLSQDDDVFELGGDFEYYSVVTEVPNTRWKLAISQPFRKTQVNG
jgi:hypothetical protein